MQMHVSFKYEVVLNDTCGLHGGEKQKLPGHLRGLAAEKSANSPCPGGQRASSVPMVKSSWTVESASSITSPSRAASRSPCSLRMGHLWAACLRAKFSTFSGPLGAQPRNATRLSHPQQTWCAPPPTVQSPLPSPVLTTASSVHSCPFSPYSLPLVVHFTPSLPTTQAEPLAEPGALSTSPLSSQPFKPALRNE